MKLNGISCNWYDVTGKDSVEFGLETDFRTALALDGQKLVATHDDGETQVAVFDGYALAGIIADSDGGVKASFARELPDSTAQAIRGAEESARAALEQAALPPPSPWRSLGPLRTASRRRETRRRSRRANSELR